MGQPVFPADYEERVYAGVLGKIIGVYLGRPFEGWTYQRIMRELGEINYYVHERLNSPLIVTDDDISGTFTFFRALEDFACAKTLTAEQIGRTWQNYIIENRTVLWWGGMGNSTEHTAFLRLKRGIPAPRSGSMELNGRVVSEQIGSQIFIDGWAMAAPGDPEFAAELARKAASVSHDGEAIHGAQVLAAMEAQAFVERDMDKLLDVAARLIPADCVIRQLIDDIRAWRGADNDWRKTRERIEAKYGYDKFGGGCHMIPNHAVIILALVYCDDNFQRAQMIANTAGWDTDCNAGNVGCLMGIKNGLAGIDAGPDWRSPVADRLYLPTADGGRAISDAAREALSICKAGRTMAGLPPVVYKEGARYHFELPGSVQGFVFEDSIECKNIGIVWNAAGHSRKGRRSLAIGYSHLAPGRFARVATETFASIEQLARTSYPMVVSPSLYSGQMMRLGFSADEKNARPVIVRPFARHIGEGDKLAIIHGPPARMEAGAAHEFEWRIPTSGGMPICQAGIEISCAEARADGTVYLDFLTWSGAPDGLLGRQSGSNAGCARAWVSSADRFWAGENASYLMTHGDGMGLVSQGAREWESYRVSAEVQPHLARSAGLAVCVQGLKRYYALLLCPGNKLKLVKEFYGQTVLAEADFKWAFDQRVKLELQTQGAKLSAWADGRQVFKFEDKSQPLTSGAVGLLVEEGRLNFKEVMVSGA
jgi:ADP-ribosylglycohydrolase